MKLGKIFKRRPAFSRAATRYTCQLDGALMMIDRMATFDGRMIDFSAGGAMFRPRLAYLMDRRDVPVCLDVAGVEVFGRIMSTSPGGFGIRFDEPLEEAEVLQILEADRRASQVREGKPANAKVTEAADAEIW
ncbi:PilZ domain-containing protein [Sphingobium subterraneum]|uniref:PilZ domain-containing protein n=1 Tax=Sphingobium subterraneum TaxID=627688 RepID=A0A841IWK1_9SPHN|nr:PilZ domain-containing protein [Sphingobium subterraneum]MBB6123033.1 hypothetical protein [Sphingobium subterraneum]